MTKYVMNRKIILFILIGLLTTCYPIAHVVICMAVLFVKEPEGTDENKEQTDENRVIY